MKPTVAAAVAALAALVDAKADITNSVFSLQAGVPFNLTWSDSTGTGPFIINLLNGPTGNLKVVQQLTTTSDFSYVYTPPSSLPSDTYVFGIIDSTGDPNYSVGWAFSGSASASASASLTSSTASSSSSASTSASSTGSSSASTITTSAPSSSSASTSASTSTIVTTAKNNTTTTTSSASATTSTHAATTTAPANTNGAQRVASSLALFLVTVAGLVFFN